jgi:UDP-2,3-diacylglucosamine pyrophosphatase LpxH
VVLADLHLTRSTPRRITDDLARFVTEHAGARIVFAGDLFDLSAESPRVPREHAVEETILAHPAARAALARHADTGGELWFVGGNHDADVAAPGFQGALTGALGLSAEGKSRVRATPWFFREGALHIEHGHRFDPDNAPAHPLVVGGKSLGVHFVEEFIAPTGAHAYLHAVGETPLKLFVSAFRWYGTRAPYVVYRYFRTAFAAMGMSGPFYDAGDEVELGQERIAWFAEEFGVTPEMVYALLPLGAASTLESLAQTFARLYFDRVIATVSIAGGLGAIAVGQRRAGAASVGFGALLMAASWANGHNRFEGTVCDRLARGAARITETTGARLVVFGHTHREAHDDGYANTSSFSFPGTAPGRPFLEIEGTPEMPRAVRRYWPQ